MNQADQRVLFEEVDEQAYLLPHSERAKRYTAAQVEKVETVKQLVLLLIGHGAPVEVVAKGAHLSTRTVKELVKKGAEEVAGATKEFGESLVRTGARFVALARMREDEAEFADLARAAKDLIPVGAALVQMGQVAGEKSAIDVDADRVAAAAALRQVAAVPALPAPGAGDQAPGPAVEPVAAVEPVYANGPTSCTTDSCSVDEGPVPANIDRYGGGAVTGDVVQAEPEPSAAAASADPRPGPSAAAVRPPGPGAPPADPPGGGVGARGADEIPMDFSGGGL